MKLIDDQIKINYGNPILIVLVYLVFGIIWVLFSDAIIAILMKDVSSLVFMQSIKGIMFIFMTSLVLYYFINHGFKSIKSSNEFITENERRHNIILDTVGDIIVYVDKYGKILDVNKRAEIKLGYKKEDLLGKSFLDVGILDVKYISIMAKMFRQGIENKPGGRFELELKHKDGSLIAVEANNKFIVQDGEVMGAVTAFRDITERKKAMAQIDNNITHFAHLIDHIRNPLAILSTFTQVKIDDKVAKEKLLTQIDRIEEIIKQLDEGWMDSEETRKFLKDYK